MAHRIRISLDLYGKFKKKLDLGGTLGVEGGDRSGVLVGGQKCRLRGVDFALEGPACRLQDVNFALEGPANRGIRKFLWIFEILPAVFE